MDRSYYAESQNPFPENVNVKDYGINKKTLEDKQTEMFTVLKIRITPKSSKQKPFQIIQNITPRS